MSQSLKLEISAPSNIAFVKYWGKKSAQLPENPSVSMTLDHCQSIFKSEVILESENALTLEFLFNNKENEKFQSRILKILLSFGQKHPWINNSKIKINAFNTFPHSAGIASSASAFAALGTLVESVDAHISNRAFDSQRASHLARLGSGSASRSITGNINIWGECAIDYTSDQYAINFNKVHKNFSEICDCICIISNQVKKVSSSQGHESMNDHPFRESRYDNARLNVENICRAFEEGNWDKFGQILEREALSLHALMISSLDPFLLLEPKSLEVINLVWQFRKETRLPLYFTIDAGPNIHLIYPKSEKEKIHSFIESNIRPLCHNQEVIFDKMGHGVSVVFE